MSLPASAIVQSLNDEYRASESPDYISWSAHKHGEADPRAPRVSSSRSDTTGTASGAGSGAGAGASRMQTGHAYPRDRSAGLGGHDATAQVSGGAASSLGFGMGSDRASASGSRMASRSGDER